MRIAILGTLALALALGGCPEDDDDDVSGDDDTTAADDDDTGDDDTGDDDTEPPELAGACALESKVGYFQVQHEPDYSAVSGEVTDGVVPITILEEIASEGPCRLLRRNNPFCNPPCEPGTTCDFDGSCIPYPTAHGVGTVTIEGLTAPVSMEFPAYFDTTLPHPPFTPGEWIQLTAAGDEYAGFTMHGMGVTPIETEDEAWIVREEQPLIVQWIPTDEPPVEVQLRFNVDQHGNSPVELVCDLEDDGSHDVPSDLIAELLSAGVSGFATGNLYRRTVDSVEIPPGCVQFTVFSHVMGNLQVEGHIPCDEPEDCPDGMECDFATNTCI